MAERNGERRVVKYGAVGIQLAPRAPAGPVGTAVPAGWWAAVLSSRGRPGFERRPNGHGPSSSAAHATVVPSAPRSKRSLRSTGTPGLDVALGLGAPPADGPELPPGRRSVTCRAQSIPCCPLPWTPLISGPLMSSSTSGPASAAPPPCFICSPARPWSASRYKVRSSRARVSRGAARPRPPDIRRGRRGCAPPRLPTAGRSSSCTVLSAATASRDFSGGSSPSRATARCAWAASTCRCPRSPGSNRSRRRTAISPSSARDPQVRPHD